jgi:hypothetical protein
VVISINDLIALNCAMRNRLIYSRLRELSAICWNIHAQLRYAQYTGIFTQA